MMKRRRKAENADDNQRSLDMLCYSKFVSPVKIYTIFFFICKYAQKLINSIDWQGCFSKCHPNNVKPFMK